MSLFVTPRDDYKNTWISTNYCNNEPNKWDIWEGMREILQNQMDGIVSQLKKKENVRVIPGEETVNGIQYQFEFRSYDPNDTLQYGKIEYDIPNKLLTIQNIGTLETGDLLLGGTKAKENDQEIIGRFGEGMKLAALAFVRDNEEKNRKGKNFRIITRGKEWKFKIQEDSFFKKGPESQKCLHFLGRDFNSDQYKDKVTVEIKPIDLETEWVVYINKFLWLAKCQKNLDMGIVKANENGKDFREILLNPSFRNKIYVKDIFVQEFSSKDSTAVQCFFGFNTDLTLDRDRNAIKNLDDRNKLFSKILANILKRRFDLDLTPQCEDWFKTYLKDIVYMLDHDYYMIRYLNGYLTTAERDAIWEQKKEDIKQQEKSKGIVDLESIDKKQFIGSCLIAELNNFLNSKKLPHDFYPYIPIGCWVTWNVLVGSSYYKPYSTLYNEKIKNATIVEEPEELKNMFNKIVEMLQKTKKDMKRDFIKFKKCEYNNDEIVYFEGNFIYFSDKLKNSFNDKRKKNWIFKIICDYYKINLIDLIFQYNLL